MTDEYEAALAAFPRWLAFLDEQEKELQEQLERLRRKAGENGEEAQPLKVASEAVAEERTAQAAQTQTEKETEKEDPWL